MKLLLEKAFKKTINQKTELCISHQANKKGFFHFFSGESLLEILSLCPKNPSTRLEDSSIFKCSMFKSIGNRISDTQFDFSAAMTPVTVSE